MLFDSHCHLTDERFPPEEIPALLQRAAAAGVSRLVTIASDMDDAGVALAISRRFDGVWSTAGVHPHVAAQATAGDIERLGQLLHDDKVVAVGETGLDYHYDNSPRAVQRAVFEQQIALAAERALPVIVHSREAEDDTIAMIRGAGGGVRGVLHCFASSARLLDAGLDAGWLISFAGLVSFKNYDGADLVRAVPADRLMIETDSPYLAPIPHRGKRNEPAYVRDVAIALARLRGETLEQVAEVTTANAMRFYGLAANAPQLGPDPVHVNVNVNVNVSPES